MILHDVVHELLKNMKLNASEFLCRKTNADLHWLRYFNYTRKEGCGSVNVCSPSVKT